MAEPTSCCALRSGYCVRVDTLFNMPGVHVLDVAWGGALGGIAPDSRVASDGDWMSGLRGDRGRAWAAAATVA
jgi:hypothetical protein